MVRDNRFRAEFIVVYFSFNNGTSHKLLLLMRQPALPITFRLCTVSTI